MRWRFHASAENEAGGNGKGHHDTFVDLKRLLCFWVETRRELRRLVGRKGRVCAAVQAKAQHPERDIAEPLDVEHEADLDIPVSDLRLGIAVLDWWEVER